MGQGVAIERGVRISVADGGRLEIGNHAFVDVGSTLHVGPGGRLRLGSSSFVGHHSTLAAEEDVSIGEGTFLAELVSVRDHDHRVGLPPRDGGVVTTPVLIGDDVWIGSKATVLRGVTIGHGGIVGAHALVRSDVPARHLAAGVPATVIRSLDRGDVERS